ncbi:MAG: hypothetical protein RMJ57_00030 [Bacteroidia bacterium]|nr:hypothetical protein [Bacteroidia bacterium]
MALAAIFAYLWGQLTFNPLSGYGTGFPHLTASGGGLGMGRLSVVGLGAGLPEQPAHSAHLSAMQADFSGYGRSQILRTSTQRARFGSGSLQNLQMSFARGKGWGFAIGLSPQALQGYQGSSHLRSPLAFRYAEKAEGLLSLAYLQVGFRWKQLGLGYQFGYLWGTYERQRSIQLLDQLLPDLLLTTLRLSGVQHRIGALWQDSLKSWAYQLSLSYALPTQLHYELTYSFQKNFSLTSILVDTFANGGGKMDYSPALRGGFTIGNAQWRMGVEGAVVKGGQKWSGAGLPSAEGRTGWDVRFGIEWQPDSRSNAFYKRLRYQGGGYVAQMPYVDLHFYGVTTGIGWQFPRSPNLVYLAVEYGHAPHPQIRETFLQVSVAAVFRELWFIPPRID